MGKDTEERWLIKGAKEGRERKQKLEMRSAELVGSGES